ncbi:glycosyltransferase involved in cell wall biosynthesis [Variovorax sp. TBS-050B]|uniref:glycosyltransferase family 2 protein n=1 Tax=Variovorax sp. TBS-050B TaxID=2940551 RepID=UPI0024731B55|nr:glycosyltransferase [Variovorax sp. TBS-050B]MDH6594948.1 glycosyltransferase involved in cell wall biosynthesis [Variovorax sp. TBS-050B]
MDDKLVSICIPVFNGSNYLKKAIESALAQDYPHVEVIVVNDGSTDGGLTEAIALEYGNRIRYIKQENRGVAGALNTAVAHAKGTYFAWLSHDDIHLPHKTSAQMRFLSDLGRTDACLFSDYDLIDPDDKLITTVRLPVDRIRRSPRLPLLNGMINGCSLLVPIAAMREFGVFDERLRFTQDYDLWNKILDKQEFFHQPEVLIQYRVHPQQDTQTQKLAPESDPLWTRMIDDRSPTQRAQLSGSSRRFYQSLGVFLELTPMQKASAHALNLAKHASRDTLTSVVIPFFNEINLLHRAVESVRSQIGARFEIILVDDGSTEDTSSIERLAQSDERIKLIRQANRGAAAARNRGMMSAKGEYIAFLDGDDTFMPNKIRRQLDLMQEHGALFSHTSYYISYPERKNSLGIWHSGQFGGRCYPELIRSCPIAVPTVMLHRSIVDEGFLFPAGCHLGEDILAWIDLAAKYLLLGIDEPLSVVEWSATSAAMSLDKQVRGVAAMIEIIQSHPIHGKHLAELDSLRAHLEEITAQRARVSEADWAVPLIDQAWNISQSVPLEAIGRI